MKNYFQIAIDGPAGSGKSTIGKMLSKNLNFLYLDSGAMYRAFALKALMQKINVKNEKDVDTLAKTTVLDLTRDGKVYLDGVEVSAKIRTPEVSQAASIVSSYKSIRAYSTNRQRELSASNDVVMDGRDIGSIVLPNAQLKVFLTASSFVRAQRRKIELDQKGITQSLKEIELEIVERDNRDYTRIEAPLIKTPGAIEINTDDNSVDEVFARILKIYQERKL